LTEYSALPTTESADVWGFTDTQFRFNERGEVEVSGTRYRDLSGHELPHLRSWFERVTGLAFQADDRIASHYPPEIEPSRATSDLMDDLRRATSADHVTDDARVRLRHGHGHTQEEMFAIKYGRGFRVPDCVVFPEAEAQVQSIVDIALRRNACVIPFGGGTNVTKAVRCPDGETRAIISVDLRRMNRIVWLDRANRMACIEAGAVGRDIISALAAEGFTMGHEPDSVEFSTLGGWIATHASGMKKNRYGNIEDLVLDVTAVTASGRLERQNTVPRESTGIDPRRWLFGSEGNLGIVTCAVGKLCPLPEACEYGSVLFKTFEQGLAFMRALSDAGNLPASVRLMDNLQFQLGMALKPAKHGLAALGSRMQKWLVTGPLGFDPDEMVACTLVFEGPRRQVERQQRDVYALAKRHGGMKGGAENGKRGYQLTYGIAYIRDFIMRHWYLAESFETSVPWSKAAELCARVKSVILDECARRGLPGTPFVSYRVTQVYDTGCVIYFYFAFNYKGVENPSDVYHEIENIAREEVLRCGGSLSHHHGVGKLRQSFLPKVMSPASLYWIAAAKRAVDPDNVFAAGNLHSDGR
jgi:alkyldihydroxyacetonephosphate synthase